jgi:hypothetical protein
MIRSLLRRTPDELTSTEQTALGCAGLAKSTARDFAGAAREFRKAIDFARHAKVGLEFEARLLGDLADTR